VEIQEKYFDKPYSNNKNTHQNEVFWLFIADFHSFVLFICQKGVISG